MPVDVTLIVTDVPPLITLAAAGRLEVDVPSLTLITTFANVPTLAAAGVPESVPLVVSKVAQDGRPWML